MPCYCGLATRQNRVRWAVVIVGVLAGVALIGAAIGLAARDYNDYTNCLQGLVDEKKITQSQYDYYKQSPGFDSNYGDTGNSYVDSCQNQYLSNRSSGVGACFWIGVIVLVIASIPCYMMCCCTHHPDSIVVGHAVAVPYAQPYGAQQYDGQQGAYAQPYAQPYQGAATSYNAPYQTPYQAPYQTPYQTQAPVGYPSNVEMTEQNYPKY